MKTFNPATLASLAAGRVDYIDAVTLVFDSGVVNGFLHGTGMIPWEDDGIGAQTFFGMGSLVDIDVPENGLGPESRAITLRLYETYLTEGSDVPVNVFDDNVRATIDEEEWEGRTAILSIFWRDENGTIIEREQVDRKSVV